MSEWKKVKLSKGKTYGGLSGKSAKDFVSGDSPYVTFMEVLSNVKLTKPPTAKVKIKSGESQNVVKKNDLLLNGSSETPEEVAIPTSVNFSPDIPIYLNSFCFGYRPDTDDIDSDFLSYFLRSSEGREIIVQLAAGSTRYNISKRSFTNLELLLPPLPEQQRIARVLGDIDDEIATLEELVAKKRLVKTAVMQQLLTGKVRLTADGRAVTGAEIERERERQLGHLQPWRRVKLGEIGMIVGGGTPSTGISRFWGGNIQWFTPAEINGKYADFSERTITQEGLSNSSAKLLPEGTVIFTSRATIGEVAIAKNELTTNQGFQSVVVSEEHNNIFMYYLLNTQKNEFIKKASGSTFLEISPDNMRSVEMLVPDGPEQTRIADILTDIDDDITTHEKLISKKRQVKTGVMQQLLTGKTRLLEAV